MNEKRKLFVREYLKDFNGTRAYKQIYKCSEETAKVNASKLLTKTNIQEAIQKQANKKLEKVDVDIEYIISNIKEVTERCMQKVPVMYYDKIGKEWKQEKELVEQEDGTTKEEGIWKFDSGNALKGLELLGKYKSIFSDKIELEQSKPFEVKIEVIKNES